MNRRAARNRHRREPKQNAEHRRIIRRMFRRADVSLMAALVNVFATEARIADSSGWLP